MSLTEASLHVERVRRSSPTSGFTSLRTSSMKNKDKRYVAVTIRFQSGKEQRISGGMTRNPARERF
jgi:hypothetical protein